MRGDDPGALAASREAAIKRAARSMRPKRLSKDLRQEWNRVAVILAEPTVDRLKPRFADVIMEYCRVCVRLRNLRAAFDKLAKQVADNTGNAPDPIAAEVYTSKGRNGPHPHMHPYVGQINEAWRQWRSLVGMLGLSPADERNMLPGQGDLFDESEREFA